jgi:hypothetical protein
MVSAEDAQHADELLRTLRQAVASKTDSRLGS